MAKYKPYSYDQGQFIPVFFSKQILPGTFEFALTQLIDNKLNLSIFDKKFQNDVQRSLPEGVKVKDVEIFASPFGLEAGW
jgi:hypothetical protein